MSDLFKNNDDIKSFASSKHEEIFEILDQSSPKEIRFLPHFKENWKFLFCVILSARTTDKMVTSVAPTLFNRYPTLESFRDANIEELIQVIHKIGFFENKAKNLILCATKLLAEFNGELPKTMEELVTLPGVGRKTASCILGDIYGLPAVIVDTHFTRVCNRLGLVNTEDAKKIEGIIKSDFPQKTWYRLSMTLNLFGRTICTSFSPKCLTCSLSKFCQNK